MSRKKYHIAVLLTCHNRRDLTVASVGALAVAADDAADLTVILVDAGSSDGTVEAVLAVAPDAQVLRRGPDLYWNSGMREAWTYALFLSKPVDFYLWLNDDLQLSQRAIRNLLEEYDLEASRYGTRVIVAGRTTDPDTGAPTYGGFARNSNLSRISLRQVGVDERYCAAVNGNCVLIPVGAVSEIGILSCRYTHSFGDIDYSFRAARAGYVMVQSPYPVGEQRLNEDAIYGIRNSKLTMRELRKVLKDPKGIPLLEWLYFCRTHAGPLWPINFIIRYLRLFQLW